MALEPESCRVPCCSFEVMQMLRDIKAGKPVEACTRAPAIGSYLHKKAGRCDLLCLCGLHSDSPMAQETATKQTSKGGRSRPERQPAVQAV